MLRCISHSCRISLWQARAHYNSSPCLCDVVNSRLIAGQSRCKFPSSRQIGSRRWNVRTNRLAYSQCDLLKHNVRCLFVKMLFTLPFGRPWFCSANYPIWIFQKLFLLFFISCDTKKLPFVSVSTPLLWIGDFYRMDFIYATLTHFKRNIASKSSLLINLSQKCVVFDTFRSTFA